MEMVGNDELEHMHISFMTAGHTHLTGCFVIVNAYKAADVFTIHELQVLCAETAHTCRRRRAYVLTRRKILGMK